MTRRPSSAQLALRTRLIESTLDSRRRPNRQLSHSRVAHARWRRRCRQNSGWRTPSPSSPRSFRTTGRSSPLVRPARCVLRLRHHHGHRPGGLALAAALAELAALRSVDDAAYLVGSAYAACCPMDFVPSMASSTRRRPWSVDCSTRPRLRRGLGSRSRSRSRVWRRGVPWSRGAEDGRVAEGLRSSGDPSQPVEPACGFEIDPFAAWMSLSFLDATLNELLGFSGDDQLSPIKVCDSLTQFEAGNFDLVVGNPPYGGSLCRSTCVPSTSAAFSSRQSLRSVSRPGGSQSSRRWRRGLRDADQLPVR